LRRFSKIAAVALVGALALTGCGSGSGSSDDGGSNAAADSCKAAKGDGPKVGLAYDVGGRGDQSFNDSAYVGMEKAIKEVGATCTEAKAAPK
jgi:basic membrane protein A